LEDDPAITVLDDHGDDAFGFDDPLALRDLEPDIAEQLLLLC
jgi:hypothetical protein